MDIKKNGYENQRCGEMALDHVHCPRPSVYKAQKCSHWLNNHNNNTCQDTVKK